MSDIATDLLTPPRLIREMVDDFEWPAEILQSRTTIQVGDIRKISTYPYCQGAGNTRLGLIYEKNDDTAEIMLIHGGVALSTEADLVLSGTDVGTGFPVVIQTDMRGVVWSTQKVDSLDDVPFRFQTMDKVGACSDSAMDEIRQIAGLSSVVETNERGGAPLEDDRDPRWHKKLEELSALRNLTSHCNRALLHEQQRIDWALLVPELIEADPQRDRTLRDLVALFRRDMNRPMLTIEDVKNLKQHEALERAEWDRLGDLGRPMYEMLVRQVELATRKPTESSAGSEYVGRRPLKRKGKVGALMPGSESLLHTSSRLWAEDDISVVEETWTQIHWFAR